MSPPQIDQAAAAVIIPAKPRNIFCIPFQYHEPAGGKECSAYAGVHCSIYWCRHPGGSLDRCLVVYNFEVESNKQGCQNDESNTGDQVAYIPQNQLDKRFREQKDCTVQCPEEDDR
nr:hypothetical protein CFP56_71064 [Quercus suber]